MRKYIKWILLVILIISIIITVILFVIYMNNYNKIDDDTTNKMDSVISKLYDNHWYINKLEISKEGDIIVSESMMGTKYLIFKKDIVSYCDNSIEECQNSKYTYDNDVVDMPLDYMFGKGSYNIKLNDNVLMLSREYNERIITYYFETAKG